MPETLRKEKKRLYDIGYRARNRGKRLEQAMVYYLEHKDELQVKHRDYLREHPEKRRRVSMEKMRGYVSKHHLKFKTELLTHYGYGECACVKCGFSDIRALSIDHINGGGFQHRRELEKQGKGHRRNFYYWLKKEGYPEGFQTLCMNCQFIKRFEDREDRKV